MEQLRIALNDYKKSFSNISKTLSNKPIFIIFDDFYFIKKSIQPDFIDYFHRLTKDTPVFIKIATIKHRSKLYISAHGNFIGVELQHDVVPIDLDYTLDQFRPLVDFMEQILDQILKTSECEWIKKVFAGDGFAQLCLASGGVPRDFLSLFTSLLDKFANKSISRIGKVEVTECAINNISSKLESFRTDSVEEIDALEEYLNQIKVFVIGTKKQNTFLVPKDELDRLPKERQAIRELCDLRFFHLVDSNISAAPSDGRRYEAYIVDPGLYPNARPVKFIQIDPTEEDEKSRKDSLRASPRLDLEKLKESVGAKSQYIQESGN